MKDSRTREQRNGMEGLGNCRKGGKGKTKVEKSVPRLMSHKEQRG